MLRLYQILFFLKGADIRILAFFIRFLCVQMLDDRRQKQRAAEYQLWNVESRRKKISLFKIHCSIFKSGKVPVNREPRAP